MYHLGDALGSVRQLTDSTGNVTLTKNYEPYGTALLSTGNGSSVFGYTSEQLDSYIKLLYLRARWYDGDTYLDVDDPNTESLKAALSFRLRPHYVLLDAKGDVLDQWVGTLPESDFVAAFEKALK